MAIQHRDRPLRERPVGEKGPRGRSGRRNGGGTGSFFRRWTLPVVGAITPVLLIAVNIAAFIVHHLQTFRLIITICAFISGLMLNSWAGVKVYQWIRSRYPGTAVGRDDNQELLIIGGMGVVILIAALTAWGCYAGLASDKDLPNLLTFGFGAISIIAPVVVRELFSRALSRGEAAPPPRRDDLEDLPD